MNSRTTPRGVYHPAGVPQQSYHPAPNAALLIDFDNVTMAIRSDLGKELKALLNSDVIRGKVAVQRAYADWRRYPQYIVPLAESSVDLIFAPAYGSSKKNATDLRMAIDAMELVFIRPEIGTFILMTGDSDFSSCVLKLKEYGKYVIGVGMRESSSDLLIQNCDEYYSYHSLSGLTREGDVEDSKEDPWVLVKRAVQQMVKNGDVMRTDRLKQVMLDLDPGFDEKKLGYSKFSRFVSEAASKGLIRLRKLENGQYEIVDAEAEEEPREKARDSREKVVERIVAEAEAAGNGRRRRGRGRDEAREKPEPVKAEVEAAGAEEEAEEIIEPVAAAAPAAEEVAEAAAPEPVSTAAAGEEPAATSDDLMRAYALLQEAVRQLGTRDGKGVRDGDVKRKMLELSSTFDEGALGFGKFTRFLRQAHDAEVIDLTRAGAGNYEVSLPAGGRRLPPPRLTAPAVEPAAKRSAPEAEKVVVEPKAQKAEPAREAPRAEPALAEPAREAAAAPAAAGRPLVPGALRGRRGGRPALEGPPPILPGQAIRSPLQSEEVAAVGKKVEPPTEPVEVEVTPPVEAASEAAAAAVQEEPPAAREGRGRSRGRRGRGGRGRAAAASTETEVVTAPAAAVEEAPTVEVGADATQTEEVPSVAAEAAEATPPSRTRRGRRGGRGRTASEAPATPEAEVAEQVEPAPAVAAETESAAEVSAPATEPKREQKRTAGGRGRTRKAPAPVEAAAEPAKPKEKEKGKGNRSAARSAGKAAVTEAPAAPGFSAEALGLPSGEEAVRAHLGSYRGAGKKTVDSLVERFGEGVFQALQERPDEVRELLGDRRAAGLLEQWEADYAERVRNTAPAEPESHAPAKKGRSGGGAAKRGTGGGSARKRSSAKTS